MTWLIAALLLALWLLGVVNSMTFAGLIHALLVVTVLLILFGFVMGRPRPL
jgi:hypothetical protein